MKDKTIKLGQKYFDCDTGRTWIAEHIGFRSNHAGPPEMYVALRDIEPSNEAVPRVAKALKVVEGCLNDGWLIEVP